MPRSPCGRRSERVLHLARLLAEDRPQQALLRGQLGLALGRDLADEDVAGADLGPDVDDALLVEVLEGLLADVRDVAGDLLGPELRVARLDLVLLDVDAREQVVADEAIADDDRVLVVAALPAHERDEDVPAERELALLGRRSCRRSPRRSATRWPTSTIGPLVDARALVAAHELLEAVLVELARVGLDPDPLGGDAGHDAGAAGDDDLAGVARGALLHAGADDRRLSGSRSGTAWRCMFEPIRARLASSCSRNGMSAVATETTCLGLTSMYSIWSGPRLRELVPVARRDALVDEVAGVVERRVRLGDDVLLLLVGREVLDLVGHDRLDREGVEPSAS